MSRPPLPLPPPLRCDGCLSFAGRPSITCGCCIASCSVTHAPTPCVRSVRASRVPAKQASHVVARRVTYPVDGCRQQTRPQTVDTLGQLPGEPGEEQERHTHTHTERERETHRVKPCLTASCTGESPHVLAHMLIYSECSQRSTNACYQHGSCRWHSGAGSRGTGTYVPTRRWSPNHHHPTRPPGGGGGLPRQRTDRRRRRRHSRPRPTLQLRFLGVVSSMHRHHHHGHGDGGCGAAAGDALAVRAAAVVAAWSTLARTAALWDGTGVGVFAVGCLPPWQPGRGHIGLLRWVSLVSGCLLSWTQSPGGARSSVCSRFVSDCLLD